MGRKNKKDEEKKSEKKFSDLPTQPHSSNYPLQTTHHWIALTEGNNIQF